MKKNYFVICAMIMMISISFTAFNPEAKAAKIELIFALEDIDTTPHEEMVKEFLKQYPDVTVR